MHPAEGHYHTYPDSCIVQFAVSALWPLLRFICSPINSNVIHEDGMFCENNFIVFVELVLFCNAMTLAYIDMVC